MSNDMAIAFPAEPDPPASLDQQRISGERVPQVPDYKLLRRIGGGAYGEVWLARSLATGALRAAKVVWRDRFQDERPFQREFEGIQKFELISRQPPSQLALFRTNLDSSGNAQFGSPNRGSPERSLGTVVGSLNRGSVNMHPLCFVECALAVAPESRP